MFVLHASRKLLDRLGPPPKTDIVGSTTVLGSWYGTLLFWQPQVALFVNERTLLPVLVHLAPARTLLRRFPDSLAAVLDALSVPQPLVAKEMELMSHYQVDKGANRSVIGVTNEFSYLADAHGRPKTTVELHRLSIDLAGTPCGPLRSRSGFPDKEVSALFAPDVED
jgi:hypothetical protein